MSMFNKTLAFGLVWIVLVGGGASIVSGASLGLAAWAALLLAQAIVSLTGSFQRMSEHTRHQRDVTVLGLYPFLEGV